MKFGCTKKGYGLYPVDFITCIYNETTAKMEWDKPVPTCVGTYLLWHALVKKKLLFLSILCILSYDALMMASER